jgi:hypothetical protein
MGRIFDHWAVVYFGQFFENYKSSPNCWSPFFHSKCDNMYINGLGYILGDFFKNTSGHPGMYYVAAAELL